MRIPRFHLGRRGGIAAAIAWALACVVMIWAVLTHDEVTKARALLGDLVDNAAGAGAPGLNLGERLDRLAGGLQQARSSVDRVRRYTAPLRATGSAWSWLPAWGGDISQLNGLLEYAGGLLDGADALVASARRVTEASAVAPAAAAFRAAAAALDEEGEALDEARDKLADAGRVHADIDRESLSSGTRSIVLQAEELRADALLGAETATLLAPLASAAGTLATFGEDDSASRPERWIVDLAEIRSALSDLEQRWPEFATTAERLAPKLGVGAADAARLTGHAGQAIRELNALAGAAQEAESVLATGLPADAESADALGVSLLGMRAAAGGARAAFEALGSEGPASGLFNLAAGPLETLGTLAGFLHGFLGFSGPRVHLLLGQDDEELRPSGGFVAALWELRFDGGVLEQHRFVDSYAVDELLPLDQWQPAPAGFALGLGSAVMPFRDQNWWADFPRSAGAMRGTYEAGKGVRPDTLVAFNQAALEGFLRATGPLSLDGPPGTPDSVHATGLRPFLREGAATRNPASVGDDSRYASYLIGQALIDEFTGGSEVEPQRLAASLLDMLAAGDLLVAADDPDSAGSFASAGWDGGLPALIGDGFYWVESNAYSPKISHLIERTIAHRVQLGPDGSATSEITVSYGNPASPASPYCYQPSLPPQPPCYWLFFRLYLPEGAEVLEAPILPLPEGAMAARTLTPGDDTVAVADGADGGPGDVVEVSGLATIPAGQTREWRFRYRLEHAAQSDDRGLWHYSWQASRQPGMQGAAYHLDIILPPGACLVGDGGGAGPLSIDLPERRVMEATVDFTLDARGCAE